MRTKIDKSARLFSALSAAQVRLFRCESCDSKYDAQRNLQGKTHYADESTLSYFKSRILNAYKTADGLLYVLVESVQSRPDNGGYTRRAVVFDVFGEIVNERAGYNSGEWFRTTDQAEKAARDFLAGFDAVKHTAEKLAKNCKAEIAQAKRTLAALSGKITD